MIQNDLCSALPLDRQQTHEPVNLADLPLEVRVKVLRSFRENLECKILTLQSLRFLPPASFPREFERLRDHISALKTRFSETQQGLADRCEGLDALQPLKAELLASKDQKLKDLAQKIDELVLTCAKQRKATQISEILQLFLREQLGKMGVSS